MGGGGSLGTGRGVVHWVGIEGVVVGVGGGVVEGVVDWVGLQAMGGSGGGGGVGGGIQYLDC